MTVTSDRPARPNLARVTRAVFARYARVWERDFTNVAVSSHVQPIYEVWEFSILGPPGPNFHWRCRLPAPTVRRAGRSLVTLNIEDSSDTLLFMTVTSDRPARPNLARVTRAVFARYARV